MLNFRKGKRLPNHQDPFIIRPLSKDPIYFLGWPWGGTLDSLRVEVPHLARERLPRVVKVHS